MPTVPVTPPAHVTTLAGRLLAAAPALLDTLGAPGATAPALNTSRAWSPMDGAQPPWCPWVDHADATLRHGDWTFRVTSSVSHWNEAEVSGAHVALTVTHGEATVLYARCFTDGSPAVDHLDLDPSPAEAWLARLVG